MAYKIERRVADVEKSLAGEREIVIPARINFGDLADVERRLERIDRLATRITAKITAMRIRLDRLEAGIAQVEGQLGIEPDDDRADED
jgi:hypothetical protein